MDLNKDDFNTLVICSVRYALGRMTYIVSTVCDIIAQNFNHLTENTKTVILDNILEHSNHNVDRHKYTLQNKKGEYGMDCDTVEWQRIVSLLVEDFDRRNS